MWDFFSLYFFISRKSPGVSASADYHSRCVCVCEKLPSKYKFFPYTSRRCRKVRRGFAQLILRCSCENSVVSTAIAPGCNFCAFRRGDTHASVAILLLISRIWNSQFWGGSFNRSLHNQPEGKRKKTESVKRKKKGVKMWCKRGEKCKKGEWMRKKEKHEEEESERKSEKQWEREREELKFYSLLYA